MARNKYPEITEEKILNTAKKLFLEKGFEATTIQDIVDHLDGLSKGAVYHHFRSKEDIISTLSDRLFFEQNPFEEVKKRKDLSGLQKMRAAILLYHGEGEQSEISVQALDVVKNPRILVEMLESNPRILGPLWLEFIEEGIKDGSIQTNYAKELSDFMTLIDVWMIPNFYPANYEQLSHKLLFLKEMFEKMGLPLFDDDLINLILDKFPTDHKI